MRKLTNGLLWVALLLLWPALMFPQAPPKPGSWRASLDPPFYVPCSMAPYTPFADPIGGHTWYLEADTVPTLVTPGQYHEFGGTIVAAFGNHALAMIGADGMKYGISAEGKPHDFFPPPPATADLCPEWAAAGNTAPCPSRAGAYPALIARNPVWTNSMLPGGEPLRDLDCHGIMPATPAPLPPTPLRTATQKPAGGGVCCDPPNCPAGAPLPRCTTPRPTATKAPVPPAGTTSSIPTITATQEPTPAAAPIDTPTAAPSVTPSTPAPASATFPWPIVIGVVVLAGVMIFVVRRGSSGQ